MFLTEKYTIQTTSWSKRKRRQVSDMDSREGLRLGLRWPYLALAGCSSKHKSNAVDLMHSCGHIDHTHCSGPELVLHTLSISHAFAYVCLWKSNISRSSFLPRPGRSCSFNMGSPVLVAVGLNAGELGSDVLRDGRWRRVPWSRLFHFAELQFVSRRRTSFTAWCCHDCWPCRASHDHWQLVTTNSGWFAGWESTR